jgi:dihydroneopterin aldolase
VGIRPEEREKPQEVLLDVSLFLGLSGSGGGEEMARTVNYRQVMDGVSRFVSEGEFKLLEGLAEGVASLVLGTFPLVERVRVRARKAKYSVEPSMGVELERSRGPSWPSRS